MIPIDRGVHPSGDVAATDLGVVVQPEFVEQHRRRAGQTIHVTDLVSQVLRRHGVPQLSVEERRLTAGRSWWRGGSVWGVWRRFEGLSAGDRE